MKNIRVVYLHGNGGVDWAFAWAPWLKSELDKFGIETVFETFPDPELARKKFWIPFLRDQLKVDENTLLIGWSSGAVASMKYAEEFKIFGSVLIAPCYTDLGIENERISGWYDGEWNWQKIKENQNKIALFYSKNDEFIPLDEFYHIRDRLKPDYVYEFNDRGHFINQEKFEEVFDCVKKIIGIK